MGVGSFHWMTNNPEVILGTEVGFAGKSEQANTDKRAFSGNFRLSANREITIPVPVKLPGCR
jgi:hypothetical protein